VDKAPGFTSYKEASARIISFIITSLTLVWGNTLKIFTILVSLALFSHALVLWRDLVDGFALLDDKFLQLGFWWSCYLEEVSNFMQFVVSLSY
jgi:hypothetical protein